MDFVGKEIDTFDKDHDLSITSLLYLSAASTTSITISEPPAQREIFFQNSALFRKKSCLKIPVRGPYHAPHLYDETDVDAILLPDNSGF